VTAASAADRGRVAAAQRGDVPSLRLLDSSNGPALLLFPQQSAIAVGGWPAGRPGTVLDGV
jgi:hypothetical protein